MPGLDKEIVILSAARSPFGKFCGALRDLTATELGAIAGSAALEKAGIPADKIDHVIFGNAQQTSADAIYLARHIGLEVGVPASTPALTVNRICGSDFRRRPRHCGASGKNLREGDFTAEIGARRG